jgi:phosphohistidine phosphatase
MKTLCLLRHAHSEPAASLDIDDHDRVLSVRGLVEAENVGAFMKEQGIVPDILISSSSIRTKETARIAMAQVFKTGMDAIHTRFDRDLYLAPPDVIADEIREADDKYSKLVVVGHNPGFEDLAEKLARAGGEMIGKFPPSALAVFACDIDKWRDFSPRKIKLKTVFMP